MEYIRLSEGLKSYKLIPINEDVWDHIANGNKDYYVSLYKYSDQHYARWSATGSVAGIKDVTTNKLYFDFDDANNIENARKDALAVITTLIDAGVPQSAVEVTFSGMKGFGVCVDTNHTFTPEEFKRVTKALAGNLETFDTSVSDPNRIVRVTGTKHQKSNLYKFPLTIAQLSELPIETIMELAGNLDNVADEASSVAIAVEVPKNILNLKLIEEKPAKESSVSIGDDAPIDFSLKPKWLTKAKYVLQLGMFPRGKGVSHNAYMVLASTYKNQGFPKEIAYRMLKGVSERQAELFNCERFDKEELWNQVVESIYSPEWKGGQYTEENSAAIQYVMKHYSLTEDKADKELVQIKDVTSIFSNFAVNIEKNTIKLGIEVIDREVRITTSMLVGLLGSPGSGKTSIALDILNSASKNNLQSVFLSLDMGAPLVGQRLIQKHTGDHSKKIFEAYKYNTKDVAKYNKILEDNYRNINFCFRSGVTVDDIKTYIEDLDKRTGVKTKLLVIDYLECLVGPYSDSTANTAFLSQRLKDLANDLEITVLLLLQPQKHAGDPSAELVSYRNIKGSSGIEQSCSVVLTLWRPGFSPKRPDEDKYLTIAVVKNRMGSLNTFDFAWDGVQGSVWELDEYEKQELEALRDRRAKERAAESF